MVVYYIIKVNKIKQGHAWNNEDSLLWTEEYD